MFRMVYTEPWGFRKEKSVKIKNQIFVVFRAIMQFSKNCYISETTWNLPKRFEMQRVKTSNMILHEYWAWKPQRYIRIWWLNKLYISCKNGLYKISYDLNAKTTILGWRKGLFEMHWIERNPFLNISRG